MVREASAWTAGWLAALPVSLPFALPLLLVLLLGAAMLWRRPLPALLAAAPWMPAGALLLLLPATSGAIDLDIVLMGSRWLLDGPGRALALAAASLFLVLGLVNRWALAASPGVTVCFLLAWTGVLTLCLTGDLLLYLAGAAVAGLAMLGLTVSLGQLTAPRRAAAVAAALLAGDLALLELATLLVEAGPGSQYGDAAATLAAMRGDWLVECCLKLGVGLRLALPFAVLYWGADRSAALRALPGWLAIAAGSGFMGWRLVAAAVAEPLARWVMGLAWALALLPLVLALPAVFRAAAAVGARLGPWAAVPRDRAAQWLEGIGAAGSRRALRQAEARLTSWPLAMSLLVLVAAVLLMLARG